jgi:two-component system chemotaxis response regulator CheY
VSKAAETQPDLITIDITMPDMDGIEATRAILRDRHLPIIMVTSHGQEAMVVEAVDVGAKGYVLKPVNKAKLGTVIENVNKVYLQPS